ncbi:hypothetical protein GQX73_g6649 [Xylaria multiplex]|uniref:Methyltransferase domain-containing protein n=1 Tax=Xylaria multiplex TaxID=323545 RepID=A0A7C8IUR1_9PEZI|nr:hypothetical protein GQX73_g6649 [Xylaria multiplex]
MYRFKDLFCGFIITLGLLIFFFGFRLPYWSQNEELYTQMQCNFPLAADPKARAREFTNAFAEYKHFGEKCSISSLELHRPYDLVCPNRVSMLTAMSSGGRIGRDAPYIPRGCDMQWYTTEEVCEILGRFSQVVLVGDSMLRHVIGALNVIVRENLGYGGVTDWNFNARERQGSRPQMTFNYTILTIQGIYKTEDVIKHDPLSLACPRLRPGWSTDLRMEQMVRYPIEDVELKRLEAAIDTDPSSPKAFILGHGLWNNLEMDMSKAWLETVVKVIDSKLGLRLRLKKSRRAKNMPILLITPNAAGEKKADEHLVTQGNKALARFERAMAQEAAVQRIDHLGTWNMSIQGNLYDGVHMDMRGNLLKAMMREQKRLDYQHQIYTAVLNGKLYTSPIGDRLRNVLDVGTGTGIWAIEIGLEHPGAHITGIDLSPIQPSYAPPNVTFEICDAEDEWSFRQSFDLVHMRAMVTCFKNPRAVFEEAYRSLAPGGYIELRDPILPFQFLTPPPEGCALQEWGVKLMEAAALSGRDWGVATRYTQMLGDIGFINVTERREAIALSPWVKGKHNKELSLLLQQDILNMLEPMSMALFTRVLGWEARRVSDCLELVKRDVQNTKIHAFSEG